MPKKKPITHKFNRLSSIGANPVTAYTLCCRYVKKEVTRKQWRAITCKDCLGKRHGYGIFI